jgi:hypothetical protein
MEGNMDEVAVCRNELKRLRVRFTGTGSGVDRR